MKESPTVVFSGFLGAGRESRILNHVVVIVHTLIDPRVQRGGLMTFRNFNPDVPPGRAFHDMMGTDPMRMPRWVGTL